MSDGEITTTAPTSTAPAAPAPAPAPSPAVTSQSSAPAASPAPEPAPQQRTEAPVQASNSAQGNPAPSATTAGNEGTQANPQGNTAQPREIVAGGIKLVIDPETGARRIVDAVEPAPQENQSETKSRPDIGTQDPTALPNNIQQTNEAGNTADSGLTQGLFEQAQKSNQYSASELVQAIQQGRVDESRIPDVFKQEYQNFKQEQFKKALDAQLPTPDVNEAARQTAVEANRKFYDRVNQMAKKQAMEQVGITEDELEAAEYTDDKDLLNRAQLYETALQNAQGMILNQTREKILQQQRQQQAVESEKQAVASDIRSFVAKAQQTEPNFAAIDKMLATRYKQMPYEQAQQIAQVIEGAQHGNIDRHGAEILQQYYEDTRKAFYAQASKVGTVPTHVSRPAPVETPGAGVHPQTERPDPTQLRNMNYQQKQAWFQKYFGA